MTDAHTGESSSEEAVSNAATMRDRFRGFLPVVVDIETGGFNCHTDAILEIAIAIPSMTEEESWSSPRRTVEMSSPSRAPTSTPPHWNLPG
ncbi:MAG: hypothetical protein CM15mP74_34700 [Halieaceae bacterium]|nr:MAG: hypothetical protein CM15mP74_34700 [Halieaceae bacterium]